MAAYGKTEGRNGSKPATRAGESRLLGAAREYCGNLGIPPDQRFSTPSPRGSLSEGMRRKNATKFPSNSSIVGQKENRFVREFCGKQPCFSLLSRDKCNRCPASSVSWFNHLRICKKTSRDFVNRRSSVRFR